MTSTIRTFGFEHVAGELFWLALIFCHCFFSLFGSINGIIPIIPIGDKRLITVDVEDVAEAIKSVVEIGLDIERQPTDREGFCGLTFDAISIAEDIFSFSG